ncbi:MAG: T9SS type A sorting domain-containing protein [Candidatus Pacearchaeota archaeon]
MGKTLENLVYRAKTFGLAALGSLVLATSIPSFQNVEAYNNKQQNEYRVSQEEGVSLSGYVTNNLGEDVSGAEVNIRYENGESMKDTTLTTRSDGRWGPLSFKTVVSAEDDGSEEIPTGYNLSSNYPNPFNPSTNVVYTTPTGGAHDVEVYNILGQRLSGKTVDLSRGDHVFNISGINTPGTYLFRITDDDGENSSTEKMTSVGGGNHNNVSISHSAGSGAFSDSRFKNKQSGRSQNLQKGNFLTSEENNINISIGADYHEPWDTTFTVENSSYDLPAEIKSFPVISGTVKNVETLGGEKSAMRVYEIHKTDEDETWNHLETEKADAEGNYITDADGNFEFKLKKKASELEEMLVVQAFHGTPNDTTGYVRTETIPSYITNPEDERYNSDITIMGVSRDEHKEEFKEFLQFIGAPTKFDFDGRYLKNINDDYGDFEGLERIRVLESDPCDEDATFNDERYENIRDVIMSPDHVSRFTGNYQINENQIVFGNDEGNSYIVDCGTTDKVDNIRPSQGTIIVSPRKVFDVGGRAGQAKPYTTGGFVSRGTIYLVPRAGSGTTTHEFWHMFVKSGSHPDDPYGKTIGSSPSGEPEAGVWDEKAGDILYHELGSEDKKYSTFIWDDEGFPQWDFFTNDNIIGSDFGPENKYARKGGFYWHTNSSD